MQMHYILIYGIVSLMIISTFTQGQTQNTVTPVQITLDYNNYFKQLQEAKNYQGITNLPYLTTLIMPEVVAIYACNDSGISQLSSGFFITEQDIITCDHILHIPNFDHVTVQTYIPMYLFFGTLDAMSGYSKAKSLLPLFSQMPLPGLTYDAKIAEENTYADLARITLQNASWNQSWLSIGHGSGLAVNTSFPMLGEDVAVLASPDGKVFSVTKGSISAIRWPYEVYMKPPFAYPITLDDAINRLNFSLETHFPLYIQFDAAGTFGSSGGPLINSRGEVIGIFDKSIVYGGDTNFAIPSIYFDSVMQKMPVNEKALVRMVHREWQAM